MAFYTSVCVLVVSVEASESPHDMDDYAEVGDPTARNCESLASALAHFLQDAQPPPPSAPPTPAAALTTPAAARSSRGDITGRPGWEALAAGCLLHKGDLTEYAPPPALLAATIARTCPHAPLTLSNTLHTPTHNVQISAVQQRLPGTIHPIFRHISIFVFEYSYIHQRTLHYRPSL